MKIFCCACNTDVDCRLTNGKEIYSHRKDLWNLPFWKHDACGNFVGCHHKTTHSIKPLGCIPTKEIKVWRQKIHAVLDPLWKSGQMNRKQIYAIISRGMGSGYLYHTAEIRSVDEARKVLDIIEKAKETKK